MPINNTDKTRIQAYGCSYTAGVEFFDHLINSKADTIKRKRGLGYWNTHYLNTQDPGRQQIIQQADQLGRNSSWPAIAAQYYQVDFLNRAMGGYSLAQSVLDFEYDLIQHPDLKHNTLFVFGITTKFRLLKFNPERTSTMLLNLPEYWRDPRLDVYTVLELWNDTALTWQHLQLLQRIFAVADRAGVDVLLFDMMGLGLRIPGDPPEEIVPYMQPLFDEVWHQIRTDPRVCLDQSLHGQQPYAVHGGGHPQISMHQTFSQYVIECINSKLG